MGFPGGSDSKNLTIMQETWVPSLGRGNPLKKGMATHSNILAWRIPWTEEGRKELDMADYHTDKWTGRLHRLKHYVHRNEAVRELNGKEVDCKFIFYVKLSFILNKHVITYF